MFNILFGLLVLTGHPALSTTVLPNVGFLFRGYHLYRGNPLPTQVTSDPGFMGPIFSPTYEGNLQTDDMKYKVPDGTSVYYKNGCTQSHSQDTLQSSAEYQAMLKDMVKTNYTGFSHSFKGSGEYQDVESAHFDDDSTEHMMTQMLCTKYEVILDTVNPPGYNSQFLKYVKDVYVQWQRNNDDKRAINSLIHTLLETYGTHYVKKMDLGSRLNLQVSLNSLDRYNLEQAGIDPRVATILTMNRKMGHRLTEEELRQSKIFEKLLSTQMSGSIDEDMLIPLFYEVERLDQLFVKGMMKSAGIDYKRVQGFLAEYFSDYCENEKTFSGEDRCPDDDLLDGVSSASSKNFKVIFPERGSSSNGVLWRKKLVEMEAITVSWWMKTSPSNEESNKRRHIVSYNSNNVDHLKILASTESQGGCLTLLLDEEPLVGGSHCLIPFDDCYHHYVFTWSSAYGRWQVYIDGNVVDGGSIARGYVIPGDAYLVLGQQSNSGTIVQDPLTAFIGEIAYFYVWDFSVNGVEARNLAAVNGNVEGNMADWSQSEIKFNGEGLQVAAVTTNEGFFKV